MHRHLVRIFGMLLAGAVLAPLPAFAQSPELQTAVTAVDQSIDALLNPQAPPEEAGLQALNGVYTFTILEIKELREKLRLIEGGGIESEIRIIKDAYENHLSKAQKKIEEEQRLLADPATTLEAIQGTAQSLKEWREATLKPLISGVFDLSFLFQGGGILKVADARFSKVAEDVKNLEAVYGSDRTVPLRVYLNSAASHLKNARSLTHDAYELLLDTFSVQYPGIITRQNVLANEATASVLDAVTEPALAPEPAPTVKKLMEDALKEVSAMYKDFLQMIAVAKEQKLIK